MTHHLPSSFSSTFQPNILVFDSGIGGMGTFLELKRMKEKYQLNYVADTGFFPYGAKKDSELRERIAEVIFKSVQLLQPDMIIIACNTASTLALPLLREKFPNILILGCVPPIRWAASLSKTRILGLLSTPATARRSYVDNLQKEFAPDCIIYRHGSSTLAGEAEKIFHGEKPSKEIILTEINDLFLSPETKKIRPIDYVALGCTHYSFLLPWLEKYSPPNTHWLDPQPAVAKHAANLLSTRINAGKRVLTNDDPDHTVFLYTGDELNPDTPFYQRLKEIGFTDFQKIF